MLFWPIFYETFLCSLDVKYAPDCCILCCSECCPLFIFGDAANRKYFRVLENGFEQNNVIFHFLLQFFRLYILTIDATLLIFFFAAVVLDFFPYILAKFMAWRMLHL